MFLKGVISSRKMRRQNWILAQGLYKKLSHKTVVCCPASHWRRNFRKSWWTCAFRLIPIMTGENTDRNIILLLLKISSSSSWHCGFKVDLALLWKLYTMYPVPSTSFTFRHELSLSCPGWPWTFSTAQQGFPFGILLLQSLVKLGMYSFIPRPSLRRSVFKPKTNLLNELYFYW